MNQSEQVIEFAGMTVSDFRKFKAALRVLLAAHVTYSTAVEILLSANESRRISLRRAS